MLMCDLKLCFLSLVRFGEHFVRDKIATTNCLVWSWTIRIIIDHFVLDLDIDILLNESLSWVT